MKEYLKMEDAFSSKVDPITDWDEHGHEVKWITLLSHQAEHAAHAINSHDELVENVLHYEADALMWERRAVIEASRAQELVAEVERLRESLKWAVGNLPFENAFEWSDDENADAHYAALRLLGIKVEE